MAFKIDGVEGRDITDVIEDTFMTSCRFVFGEIDWDANRIRQRDGVQIDKYSVVSIGLDRLDKGLRNVRWN